MRPIRVIQPLSEAWNLRLMERSAKFEVREPCFKFCVTAATLSGIEDAAAFILNLEVSDCSQASKKNIKVV